MAGIHAAMDDAISSGSSPRIAIVGTGALGGLYGGLLARSGEDVHFLLRSDFQHVMRHGLRVDSIDGSFVLPRVSAYDDASSMPRCQLAVVCLKTTENSVLPRVIPKLLAPGGTVILLQNGIGEEERIAAIPGVGAVIAALGFVCAMKNGPGHVVHLDYGSLRLAEYRAAAERAGITPLLKAVGLRFEKAGVSVSLAEDWLEARWRKLVWNVPFNGLSVVLRSDTTQLLAHPESRKLVKDLMLEVADAAAGEGRDVSMDFIEKMIADTARMRPYLPSMRLDFDAGRPLETASMYRAPVQRARAVGVPAVRMTMLTEQLEFLAVGDRGVAPATRRA